jgi:hypothetical protein
MGFELPVAARSLERERCIDRELFARKLDPYGEPMGDSKTKDPPLAISRGQDRYDLVVRKWPDIGTVCTRGPGEREP